MGELEVENQRRVGDGEAAPLVEEANLTKQDDHDENPAPELPRIVWDSVLDRE